MTELVVVSGKGGTGKTSMVGALASLFDNKVLVDCDVDAADLHLITNNQVLETHSFIGGKQARIVEGKCNGCGICAEKCRFEAIHESGDLYRVDRLACDGCGVCVRQCPEEAIEFNDVMSGEWFVSETPFGPMVHARLGLAQGNSGKLVSVLRQTARKLIEEQKRDLVIIDGPPGIGCPVIASTTGASYVLIVTEPSMSAMHDMERLRELTSHFGIPTGLCINKHDINPDITAQIESFAETHDTTVLGKIPYDPAVTASQIAGSSVVEYSNGIAAKAIRQIQNRLTEEMAHRTPTGRKDIITL